MQRHHTHVAAISLVARRLSTLRTPIVFTGRAVVGLLLTDAAAPDVNADLAFCDMPPFGDRDIAATEPGFLNTYSTQNPYEDRAVIYFNLVVRHHDTLTKAANDKILARKIDYMKNLLKNFDPYFDGAFWTKVAR